MLHFKHGDWCLFGLCGSCACFNLFFFVDTALLDNYNTFTKSFQGPLVSSGHLGD